jgi:hypothetical protein
LALGVAPQTPQPYREGRRWRFKTRARRTPP